MSKRLKYKKPPKTYSSELYQCAGVSESIPSRDVPVKIAREQTDLKVCGDMLVPGEVVSEINVPELSLGALSHCNLVATYYKSKQENLPPTMIFCGDSESLLYAPNQKVKSWVVHKGFKAESYALYHSEGVNYIMLPGLNDDLVSFDGAELASHPIGHTFSHLVTHKMRLFGSERGDNKLYFSDDFQPYNWDIDLYEGGYISLPAENGAIIGMVSFGDWLVVAQERGLSRLSAYVDQTSFTLKYISVENDIISGSVVDCKDRIMYCSTSGIGMCDGYESKIYFRELADKLRDKKISASYSDRKCYFSLLGKQGGVLQTEILVIDLVSMKYYFMSNAGGDALAMVRAGDKKYILNYFSDIDLARERGNSLHYLTDNTQPNNMVWRSGKLDFGVYGADKQLRSIAFGGDSALRCKITCDGESYYYEIREKRKRILNIKGRVFEFELRPIGTDVHILPPRVEYQILEYYE